MTKNFMKKHEERSINELPISLAPLVEDIPGANTFDGYINNVVMQMGTDA